MRKQMRYQIHTKTKNINGQNCLILYSFVDPLRNDEYLHVLDFMECA